MIPTATPGCATMGTAQGNLGAPLRPWTRRDARGLSVTQMTTASRKHALGTHAATDQIARQIQLLRNISARGSSVLLGASVLAIQMARSRVFQATAASQHSVTQASKHRPSDVLE